MTHSLSQGLIYSQLGKYNDRKGGAVSTFQLSNKGLCRYFQHHNRNTNQQLVQNLKWQIRFFLCQNLLWRYWFHILLLHQKRSLCLCNYYSQHTKLNCEAFKCDQNLRLQPQKLLMFVTTALEFMAFLTSSNNSHRKLVICLHWIIPQDRKIWRKL